MQHCRRRSSSQTLEFKTAQQDPRIATRAPPPTGTVDVDAKIKGYREARDEQLQTQCPNICVASESEVSSLPNTVDIEAKINARPYGEARER